jgi:hypothetical protein
MPQGPKARKSYHILADEVLTQMSGKGDHIAASVLAQRQAIQAMVNELRGVAERSPQSRSRETYSQQVSLGDGVSLHFCGRPLWGVSLYVTLNIDPSGRLISSEVLKKHRREIRQWWDLLQRWQGPEFTSFENVIGDWKFMKDSGHSYNEIAAVVNSGLASALERILALVQTEQHRVTGEQMADLLDTPQWEKYAGGWGEHLWGVVEFFRRMGHREEDIKMWVEVAIDNLLKGKSAWPPNSKPISSEQIRSHIRAWRDRYVGHKTRSSSVNTKVV